MNKQTLEDISQIIVNEYLNKKDEIFEQEKSDKITSERANEQRTKLIGMMTAVEVIQKEIKNIKVDNYKCEECEGISSAEEINKATIKYFKTNDIEPITGDKYDGDYMCPKCNELVSGNSFTKSN